MSKKLSFIESVDVTKPGPSHRAALRFSEIYISKKKVLNIGSWTGNYEYLLGDIPKQSVGIDIDKRVIKVARDACPKSEFFHASATSLPFKNSSFDVVTMWLVLEHLPTNSESVVFSEINRVLIKNGTLIFSTAGGSFISKLLDPGFFFVGHRHYSEDKGKIIYESLKTKINGIVSGNEKFSEISPGGSLGILTELDPTFVKSDSLAGNIAGLPGKLPPMYSQLKLKPKLIKRVVGVKENIEVEPLKKDELLMINVNSAVTVGEIKNISKGIVYINLRLPVLASKEDRFALSRKVGARWHLIGIGELV